MLKSCQNVYKNRVKLVDEKYTSKRDCYSKEDLRKMYHSKNQKGNIHVKRQKKNVEVRGLRLCSAKGVSVSSEYRNCHYVDRDINACVNIYNAGTSDERPAYLEKIEK